MGQDLAVDTLDHGPHIGVLDMWWFFLGVIVGVVVTSLYFRRLIRIADRKVAIASTNVAHAYKQIAERTALIKELRALKLQETKYEYEHPRGGH